MSVIRRFGLFVSRTGGHDVHGVHLERRTHPACRQEYDEADIFEYERPIGIQLFGGEIGSMREAALIAEAATAGSHRHQLRLSGQGGRLQGRRRRATTGHPEDGEDDRRDRQAVKAAGDGEDPSRLG